MSRQALPQEPNADKSFHEARAFIVTIVATIALLAFCTVGPIWLGRHFGPGVGLVGSVAALGSWVYLGPKPMPGFLPGIICLNGFALITGVGIAEFIHLIK